MTETRIKEINVEKLHKHSQQQRRQLRRFNTVFRGMRTYKVNLEWKMRYHTAIERIMQLEKQPGRVACFLGGMFVAGMIAWIVQ